MSSLKVCDYVTIHAKGIPTVQPAETGAVAITPNPNQIYEFDIPNTYYSNQRSQVCTVEITSGVVKSSVGTVKDVIIHYLNGGVNHYVSNSLRPVIGNATKRITTTANETTIAHSMLINPTGALLCNARPQKISIQFMNLTYTGGNLTPPSLTTETQVFNFMITLKYSYYDSIETARELQREKTPHMM